MSREPRGRERPSAVRLFSNPLADHDAVAGVAERLLPVDGFWRARAVITRWTGYDVTPLRSLPGLAAQLGIAKVFVKDEASRFGLGSFKALGGAYAVYLRLADAIESATGARPAPEDLLGDRHRDVTSTITVTCATDGNHGRSVAWGARLFGCRCVIHLHEHVSDGRERAIRDLGAEIVRTPGTYDDSVVRNRRDAEDHGWVIVSDTAPGPDVGTALDVMQGYRIMVEEAVTQLPPDTDVTHVLVQGGCGGLAAAVRAHIAARLDHRPRFVVVEPHAAACLYESARVGHPVMVPGDLDTIMAGLSVGEVSVPAWRVLSIGTDAFVTIPDEAAASAMSLLAEGDDGDPVVVAGESGAAGVGALAVAAADGDLRAQLELDGTSRVLLFNTEGDTDPVIYEQIVGRSAQEVRQGV